MLRLYTVTLRSKINGWHRSFKLYATSHAAAKWRAACQQAEDEFGAFTSLDVMEVLLNTRQSVTRYTA